MSEPDELIDYDWSKLYEENHLDDDFYSGDNSTLDLFEYDFDRYSEDE